MSRRVVVGERNGTRKVLGSGKYVSDECCKGFSRMQVGGFWPERLGIQPMLLVEALDNRLVLVADAFAFADAGADRPWGRAECTWPAMTLKESVCTRLQSRMPQLRQFGSAGGYNSCQREGKEGNHHMPCQSYRRSSTTRCMSSVTAPLQERRVV